MPRENGSRQSFPQLRNLDASSVMLLAELMYNAYKGTIDSEDESLEDAIQEVEAYMSNAPLLDSSVMMIEGTECLSACLVTYLQKQEAPLIAYIMTRKECKRTGLAAGLLEAVIQSLEVAGHKRVLAAITKGNVASEQLFASFGFQRLD